MWRRDILSVLSPRFGVRFGSAQLSSVRLHHTPAGRDAAERLSLSLSLSLSLALSVSLSLPPTCKHNTCHAGNNNNVATSCVYFQNKKKPLKKHLIIQGPVYKLSASSHFYFEGNSERLASFTAAAEGTPHFSLCFAGPDCVDTHTHTHRMWSVVTEIPGCLTWCFYRNRLTNTLISYKGMTTDLNWLTLIFWLQCNILLGKLDFCPSCEWHFTHTTHPNTAAGILQSDNLVNNCYFF